MIRNVLEVLFHEERFLSCCCRTGSVAGARCEKVSMGNGHVCCESSEPWVSVRTLRHTLGQCRKLNGDESSSGVNRAERVMNNEVSFAGADVEVAPCKHALWPLVQRRERRLGWGGLGVKRTVGMKRTAVNGNPSLQSQYWCTLYTCIQMTTSCCGNNLACRPACRCKAVARL